ncbi:MAG: outer membrane beta-barrel protein, partial [Candidatus Zixiibacteriota bacterium]
MRNSLFLTVFTIAAIMMSCFGSAGAVEKTFKMADKQFYLGGGFAYNSIGGDFNGDHLLSGHSETILIPEINPGIGFGLTAGYSTKMSPLFYFGIEAAFSLTSQDYDFDILDEHNDVTAMFFDFNVKAIYGPQMIQPYLLPGVSAPYIKLKDAAANDYFLEDARFTGLGLNFGAGMDLYISPRVFFDINMMYRLTRLNEVEGV